MQTFVLYLCECPPCTLKVYSLSAPSFPKEDLQGSFRRPQGQMLCAIGQDWQTVGSQVHSQVTNLEFTHEFLCYSTVRRSALKGDHHSRKCLIGRALSCLASHQVLYSNVLGSIPTLVRMMSSNFFKPSQYLNTIQRPLIITPIHHVQGFSRFRPLFGNHHPDYLLCCHQNQLLILFKKFYILEEGINFSSGVDQLQIGFPGEVCQISCS